MGRFLAAARGLQFCAVLFLGVLGGVSAAGADELHAFVFAGSGAVGIEDGPAPNASFMMPTQMAFAPDGRLFVADMAAQRIRIIAPDGIVSTLAGSGNPNASGLWVDGGFRDGPVASARFDRPDGIAVSADGTTAYVADRDNHCIRAIARGVVSTYAGSPAQAGDENGQRAAARFDAPGQLTLDVDGSLYVADWGTGVRRISAEGLVSTLKVDVTHPTSVSLGRSGVQTVLYIADALGIVKYDVAQKTSYRIAAYPTGGEQFWPINSDFPLGIPHAVAAFGPNEVVYTDLRDSSVKYLKGNQFVRYLGQTPSEDAMITGGGTGFGPDGPRYDSPMGVALGKDGDVIVADAGNRRLIRIAPFNRSGEVTPETVTSLEFEPGSYRVAIVGSSLTWYFSDFDGSIAGQLQRRLATLPQLRRQPPSLRYFRLTIDPELDLMRNVFARGAVDLVIWMIAPGDYFPPGKDPEGWRAGQNAQAWQPALHEDVRATVDALNAGHVPVLLVVNPSYWSLDPVAAANYTEERMPVKSDYVSGERQVLEALSSVKAPIIDLFPAVRKEVRLPNHHPIFMTSDPHYTPYGRAFIAGLLFDELQRRQLWNRAR